MDTPRPSPRTNRTRRVPHPVLIGHAASAAQIPQGPEGREFDVTYYNRDTVCRPACRRVDTWWEEDKSSYLAGFRELPSVHLTELLSRELPSVQLLPIMVALRTCRLPAAAAAAPRRPPPPVGPDIAPPPSLAAQVNVTKWTYKDAEGNVMDVRPSPTPRSSPRSRRATVAHAGGASPPSRAE